ncbi:MAG TPA: hypothetical protein VFI02_14700 [Armatimonadota bacterium]|nr:hypothetical protein [Armatimonadota bacterium]
MCCRYVTAYEEDFPVGFGFSDSLPHVFSAGLRHHQVQHGQVYLADMAFE